jgi:hypothetical protein
MEAYKLEDVTVLDDAIALIRRHPEMYLASETPGPHLAGRLVHDLALLGALPASVRQDGAWWLVSAEEDWLRAASGDISTDPFFRIIPCPRWGRYAFRTEVLLTAFADAVVTAAGSRVSWIVGDGRTEQLPASLRAAMDAAGTGRHVAFRMASDGKTPTE